MRLCNLLGERLLNESGNGNSYDYGATVCFMCCVNVEKLIELWTLSLADSKKETDLVLYNCIVKALAYINSPYVAANYKFCVNRNQVAALSHIICKYANLLANQGSLSTAQEFLHFVQQFKTPGIFFFLVFFFSLSLHKTIGFFFVFFCKHSGLTNE